MFAVLRSVFQCLRGQVIEEQAHEKETISQKEKQETALRTIDRVLKAAAENKSFSEIMEIAKSDPTLRIARFQFPKLSVLKDMDCEVDAKETQTESKDAAERKYNLPQTSEPSSDVSLEPAEEVEEAGDKPQESGASEIGASKPLGAKSHEANDFDSSDRVVRRKKSLHSRMLVGLGPVLSNSQHMELRPDYRGRVKEVRFDPTLKYRYFAPAHRLPLNCR